MIEKEGESAGDSDSDYHASEEKEGESLDKTPYFYP